MEYGEYWLDPRKSQFYFVTFYSNGGFDADEACGRERLLAMRSGLVVKNRSPHSAKKV